MKPHLLRRVWIGLFVLLLGHRADAAEIRVFSNFSGSVYIRQTGTLPFYLAAPQTPASINVDSGGIYDLRVMGHVTFFQVVRGEQPKVLAGTTLTVPVTVEWDWARIGPLAALLGAALAGSVGVVLGRRHRMVPEVAPSPPPVSAATGGKLVPGQTLGSYQVVAALARGGMGSVYEVQDRDGARFAMKVPELKVLESEEYRERFKREIQIGQQLQHPNIVRIFDYSLGDDQHPTPFIILELVQGGSLKDVFRREQAMGLERALHFVDSILRALEYGHERGIIHRDVKPGNVLICSRTGLAKLSDYGIARAAHLDTLTATEDAIGTPLYMAPEQIRARDVDRRADLYGVGVILFEAVTGTVPFDGADGQVLLMRKLALDPPLPSQVNPRLPGFLDQVAARAMAREPEDRYQTAQEFLDDLNQLLDPPTRAV